MIGSSNAPGKTLNEPASYTIKVGGTPLSSDFQVYSVDVIKGVNKLSRATIKIAGGDPKGHSFDESEDRKFEPGSSVSIALGYAEKNEVVYEGIIEKHCLSISEGFQVDPARSLLVLECVDKAIKLVNTYTNDVYEKKTDSQIFTTLASKVSGLSKTITTTKVKHDYLPKYNINDWEFIIERAQANGMIVLNSDNKLTVQEPKSKSSSAALTVTNGKATISFEAEINAGSQLGTMELNTYDPYTQKAVKGSSSEPSLGTHGNLSGKKISAVSSPTKNTLYLSQNIQSKEVKELADAYLVKSRTSRMVGNAKVKGVGSVDLGNLIELTGFGARFDGKAFVTRLEHHMRNGEYVTAIGFGVRKEFFNSEKGINIGQLTRPIEGLHIGEVKQIDKDPKNELRILIDIPTLNTGKGIWAKLSHFYTTPKGGSFFIPEVKTQVVVSFISNDARFPIILGSLYTKKNDPYVKSINKTNDYKAIVTKNKLTFEFDDKNKIMTMMTSPKNAITIADKDGKSQAGKQMKKGLRIEDANGNMIITSSEGIKLISKKDIVITSKKSVSIVGSKGVSISGKSGTGVSAKGNKIDLNSKTILNTKAKATNIKASGNVNVKGKMVNLN